MNFNLFVRLAMCGLMLLSLVKGKKTANKINNKQQRLLLMSLDGFRYDYIDKYDMKNFKKIVQDGVRAKYMKSQFSTQTFPNHWTIVTGLYEENHGMVSNTFYDPLYNDTFVKTDINLKWWNASEPIWYTAVRNNLKTGSYFWPGSETVFFQTPLYTYLKYNDTVALRTKIDKVMDWFTNENYTFVAMYHLQPDYHSHVYGLDSEVFNQTIASIDEDVGYLISRLQAANLYDTDDFNLIVLSDHGMASLNNSVVLEKSIPDIENYAKAVAIGGNNIHLKLYQNTNLSVLLSKLKSLPNIITYLKEDIPNEWHYKNNRRVSDVLLVPKENTALVSYLNKPNSTIRIDKADHGYDNSLQSMRALFIAKGYVFKKGFESDSYIENIDVHPLVCNILAIKCPNTNGSFERVSQFLYSSARSHFNFSYYILFIFFIIKSFIILF